MIKNLYVFVDDLWRQKKTLSSDHSKKQTKLNKEKKIK